MRITEPENFSAVPNDECGHSRMSIACSLILDDFRFFQTRVQLRTMFINITAPLKRRRYLNALQFILDVDGRRPCVRVTELNQSTIVIMQITAHAHIGDVDARAITPIRTSIYRRRVTARAW